MSARETIIPVFVPHLGCPNNCVFCNQRHISGEQKPADENTVFKAVRAAAAISANGTKRQLAFYGGSFTAIPQQHMSRLLNAAMELYENGEIDSIRLSTRPDAVNDKVLSILKEYPVEIIELGAQSMDDEVLLLSGRGHSAADVINASRLVKEYGFKLILQFMTGLPGDCMEKDVQTAKSIISLQPDGVRIYPTVIIRDTPLYDMWKSGKYSEHTVEDAVSICSMLVPMFTEAGIPIIRLGLNPSDDLSAGQAAGGAYHPALGELVLSRIMLNRASEVLSGVPSGSRVVLGVNPSCISQMTGQHRCNVERLMKDHSLSELKIMKTEVKNGEVVIISVE